MSFIIVTQDLDGHNGLGRPDTTVEESVEDVKEFLLDWTGRHGSWFVLEDEDIVLTRDAVEARVKEWDGTSEFRIEHEDGPYIQVNLNL